MKNPVVHFEIPADDVQRALRFYERIFDWKFKKFESPDGDYWLVQTAETDRSGMPTRRGAINGGLTKRKMPGQPFVNYIFVDSIDETLTKITSQGGVVIHPKEDIGAEMGSYALFRDTEGNIMGVVEMGARQRARK